MTTNRRIVTSQADRRTSSGRRTGKSTVGMSSDHQLSLAVIALAVAARMARDPRTYEIALVVAITIAAVAGLGRASGARSFARLAAWDQRRHSERTMHTKGARKPRG
jgi:acid phosphatase family membrane protein YuiD